MAALALVLFLVSLECCSVFCTSTNAYNAVVVEYYPISKSTWNSTANIANNVDRFTKIIKTANKNYMADIVVFPESALDGYVLPQKGFVLPDPKLKIQTCYLREYDSMLRELACAASITRKYVVVNLLEQSLDRYNRTVYYNTDVVFDRKGAIIARHRKAHIYKPDGVESSLDGDIVYFDTDFDVRFGLITSDVITRSLGVVRENGVRHYILPTKRFNHGRFTSEEEDRSNWAQNFDVVLLTSQYNEQPTGSRGSGIYLGQRGRLTYNITNLEGADLLHANVPKYSTYR